MAVACLGEALIDLVPRPGESPASAAQLSIQPGGAPLNIAVGLSKLGTNALFLGCLSDDAFGLRLASVLGEHDLPRIPPDAVSRPTRLAVVDHLNTASPFRFYGAATADTALRPDDVDVALEKHDVKALYVSSLMMTDANGRSTQDHAIKQARDREIPIFSDPNPRPAAWSSPAEMIEATDYLISNSTIAKLSLDDASALGWPTDPTELLAWCAHRFTSRIFLTGGGDGCWTRVDEVVLHAAAPRVDVLDPTGAGDASFAALISRFLATGQLGQMELRFAAAAGALATQVRGAIAGLPEYADVLEMLESWS